MSFQTEFEFVLPRGYIDSQGMVQRIGRMRLATAMDEIEALQDPRVQANDAYLPVVLLSRVITQLGEYAGAPPQVIEKMFASDMAYLEDVYLRLNNQQTVTLGVVCPHCSSRFDVQVAPLGDTAEIPGD